MSLPAISLAAYAFSTSQSAVQVTYVDATTAIVYPNQFESPLTQQLNEWIRDGGQISAYIPPPKPLPGPTQFITLAPSADTLIAQGQVLNSWVTQSSLGLETDGTYVTLTPNRSYNISFAVATWYFSSPNQYMIFAIVDENGDPVMGSKSQALISTTTWNPTTPQSNCPSQSFVFTPTEEIRIGLGCIETGGTNANVRASFSSLAIFELTNETLYALKIGPQGIPGPVGPAGPQGQLGPAGPQGPQGTQGPVGPEGNAGPVGPPGPGFTFQGVVNTVGNLPPTGNDTGDAYTVTADGDLYVWDGTQWNNSGPIQGPQGVQGTQGPQGPAGPAGLTGPAGPQGSAGPVGPQGPQGSIGPVGPIGATGATGPTGPVGPLGPQGAQGPAGPQGPPGNSANVICRSGSAAVPANTISVPYTFDTFTLPTAATAYVINLSFSFTAQGGSAYGAFQPQVTISNSTSGYNNTQYSVVPANFRVINFMNYPTGSTITYADSGLAAVGRLGFTFQYQGSWASGSSPAVFWQYTVTYW